MGDFLFGLFEVSALTAALIAAALLLGRLTARRFVPQWRYWVWLVLALRLALPVSLALPKAPVAVTVSVPAALTATVWSPPAPAVPPESVFPQAAPGGAVHPAPAPAPVALRPMAVLPVLWAGGALLFLVVEFASYFTLGNTIRRRGRGAGTYQGLPVTVCPGLSSPLLLGFFRPTIVLPEGLEGAGRDFALLHEWTHHRRHDLWYKLLLVWCNALHWFNPLVWLLRRAAAGDLELACDAQLLKGRDLGYRRSYGGALVDQVAERTPGASLTSAFSGGSRGLRARIVALLDMAPKRSGRAALAAVCILALLGGTLVVFQPGTERVAAVVYSFSGGAEDLNGPPASLTYRLADGQDPVTGTVYYQSYPPDSQEGPPLLTLSISPDAVYRDFPTTLPNSHREQHPGVVLRMQQRLSSQAHAVVPVALTVRGGVVTELAPLVQTFALPAGVNVSFLDAPADGAGMVRYENETYGFSLEIPEEAARRLAALSISSHPALGTEPQGGPGVGSVMFMDRRLLGDRAISLTQNRVGYAAVVLCYPIELLPPDPESRGHNGTYWFFLQPGSVDPARLARLVDISPAMAAQLEADCAAMETATLGILEPKPVTLEDVRPEGLRAVWQGPDETDIGWWRLELAVSFPRPVDLEPDSLTFSLELAEDSPLRSLMGSTPFSATRVYHTDMRGVTRATVVFMTGRAPADEAEFRRLTAGEPTCTLVVAHPASGAERRFPLTLDTVTD